MLDPENFTQTNMENNQPRRHQPSAMIIPRSPRLIRSKSGTSTTPSSSTSLPDHQKQTWTSNSGVKFIYKRSNSATKLRNLIKGEDQNLSPFPILKSTGTKKKADHDHDHQESKDDNFKLLQRTESKIKVPRRTRSASTSPSAWALSAGRRASPGCSPVVVPRASSPGRVSSSSWLPVSLVPVPLPKSPSSGKLKRDLSRNYNGTVSGVLKFLKQKKVSPALEEEYHQFRLVYSRLMQWRFANARAEASMAVMKRVAQKKLFNVWVRISITRNHIVEKRIQIQKLKHEIKLHQIFNSQFSLLKEWARLEGKNGEAVGRLARKLSAISTCLPLVQGANADVTSMYEAMTGTMRVLEGIKAMIANMQAQVEKACYVLTELIILLKEQNEYVTELDKRLKVLSLLEVKEKSLRVHCIQLVKESIRSQRG